MPVGRSVFLVSDLGRIKEISSSMPPRQAEDMFTAEEAFVRRGLAEEEYLTLFRDEVMRGDAESGGLAGISSFTVEEPSQEAIASRAAGLIGPIVQQLAQLGPPRWDRLTAVFSCTVAGQVVQLRFSAGNSNGDLVRVPEQIGLLVRRQRHLAARMPAGPWWRLLLTVDQRPGEGAQVTTEYDYGDRPFPADHLLTAENYRDDLAAYPRPETPAWLAEFAAGAGRPASTGDTRATPRPAPAPATAPSTPAPPASATAPTTPAPPASATLSPAPATTPPAGNAADVAMDARLREIGASHGLGAVSGVYSPTLVPGSKQGCFGVAAAICTVLGIVMLATHDALGVVVLVAGIVSFVVVLIGSSSNSSKSGMWGATFEHGAVFVESGGPVHVFRWDTTQVWQRIVRHTQYGAHVRTSYHYDLTGPGGAALSLSQSSNLAGLADPEKWGRELQEGVTRAQLPVALRALAEGGTLTFGPVQVDRRAVTARGTSMPWTEIEQVKIERGYVSVRVADRWLSLINTEASRIPNVFVFLALADHLRAAAHGE
jgi:hypothetical protein